MIVVITSADPEWGAPLSAMLRERGFDPLEVPDPFDALAMAQRPEVQALIVHANLGEDECALCLRSAARKLSDQVRRIGVGAKSDLIGDAATDWIPAEYRYLAIVTAVGEPAGPRSDAQPRSAPHAPAAATPPQQTPQQTPSAGAEIAAFDSITAASGILQDTQSTAATGAVQTSAGANANLGKSAAQSAAPSAAAHAAPSYPAYDAAGPVTLTEIHRLLQRARFDEYHVLLGVPADANAASITRAATALLNHLDDERVPAHIQDAAFADLVELRAAVEDAAAVLKVTARVNSTGNAEHADLAPHGASPLSSTPPSAAPSSLASLS